MEKQHITEDNRGARLFYGMNQGPCINCGRNPQTEGEEPVCIGCAQDAEMDIEFRSPNADSLEAAGLYNQWLAGVIRDHARREAARI